MKLILKKIIDKLGYNFEKKLPFPAVEAKKEIIKLIDLASKYSMTGKLRMYILAEAIKHVSKKSLKGDFVECGVWKGGNLILMNKLNSLYNLNKKIFGYDTFDGMSEPTDLDIDINKQKAKKIMSDTLKDDSRENIHCYSPIDDVVKNIKAHCDITNIKLIEGMVEKTLTLEKNLPEQISILRLDTDFYESTKVELEILFPKLVSGGVLIIDDYGHWEGPRKAVDDYFSENKYWLHYVDHTCRYLIKD